MTQLHHVSYSRIRAWRQRRNISLGRKMRSSWHARARVDVCSRGEQLETRATLPRFPSSACFSCLFPPHGRSTNPGSSVIPRALRPFAHLSRERRFPYSEHALRWTSAGSERCVLRLPLHSCNLQICIEIYTTACLISAANGCHIRCPRQVSEDFKSLISILKISFINIWTWHLRRKCYLANFEIFGTFSVK